MADIPVHIRYARHYAAVSENLRDTSPASAGEIMWLALVQAAQATGHGQNIGSHAQTRRGIRNIVGRLPIGNQERTRLLNITNAAVTNLHGLAYRPVDIDDRRHRAHISRASNLVEILLRHA